MIDKPFRWNLTHRSHLGRLLDGERARVYPGFENDLLRCCSRILAFAGDSDLVFVTRSSESIFDSLTDRSIRAPRDYLRYSGCTRKRSQKGRVQEEISSRLQCAHQY